MKKSVSETSDLTLLVFAAINNKRIFFLPLLFAFLYGSAQTAGDDNKIDPAFRTILTARKNGRDTVTSKSIPAHYRIAPTERLVAGNLEPVKRYNCIVYTKNTQALRDSGIVVNAVLPNFVTAWATLDQLTKMASMPEVAYVKAPHTINVQNDIAVGSTGASLLHAGKLNNTVYKGKNILVAIFDTGIDWDHPDFRNPSDTTKSRILRIWDQTLTPIAGESSPAGYNYGVEYTQVQLNDELDGTPTNYVREKDIYGHGTHVAGTAAGNGSALASKKFMGIAPEADIIIVKGGDSTFSSVNVINAISYLQTLATTLGRPIVINMSFGFLLSAHDGTDPEEVAIDQFTASAPGRAVVVAAGNDNGFNLHNRLSLAGNGSVSSNFTVPAVSTGTEIFSYKVYANNNSSLSAMLTAPDGNTLTAAAGQNPTGTVVNNNFTVALYNGVDAGNGHRYVELTVARNGTNTSSPAGSWSLSVTNNTASLLTLDGWLRKGAGFTNILLAGADSNYLVNSPGNASSAITVASYVGKLSALTSTGSLSRDLFQRQDSISSSSSRGPRIDGVMKPDISATGHSVVSCLSSDALSNYTPIITNAGLYQLLQGTSMAAPVVAGSIALLFQANPATSAAQAKNLLNTTATKDAMTELPGATPNATWGYGKTDVFKAVSASFNCSPVVRRTYQYDNSNRYAQYFAYYMPGTNHRLAVRFTPDASGKLAGAYFYTYPIVTGLLLEVRSNNAGFPGTLLGTLGIDSSSVAKGAFNYVDLSSLNISITNATDYFIVLTRNPTNSSNWGLIDENISLDNRSVVSTDGGASWSNYPYDFAIRSVVYANNQTTGNIAAASSVDIRDISTSNSFINSACALIAQLVPGGASPVTGPVTGNVWIEAGVPHYGLDPFVSRHYQLTPASNATGATGRVTLYFTQQEFTAFNNDPYSLFDLPANPTDAAGKANLRVGKYPGTSSDSSGLPASYGQAPIIIDPNDADIVWNAAYSRWEVSFDVSGFSGFVLQTKTSALPISVEYFNGKKASTGNLLNWKINCDQASVLFQVERSGDGFHFDSIGSQLATPASCSKPLSFTDPSPVSGVNYYRIRIAESNGAIRYTGIVLLKGAVATSTLYPTVLNRNTNVQVNYTGTKGSLFITDAAGKQVYTHALINGTQSLALPLRESGIYFYSIKNDEGKIAGGKIVVK
ncbi:MAG: S8 family peptidase [Williamsia sp.]|nr:S8 family peptidase [Williamsia sp.]